MNSTFDDKDIQFDKLSYLIILNKSTYNTIQNVHESSHPPL